MYPGPCHGEQSCEASNNCLGAGFERVKHTHTKTQGRCKKCGSVLGGGIFVARHPKAPAAPQFGSTAVVNPSDGTVVITQAWKEIKKATLLLQEYLPPGGVARDGDGSFIRGAFFYSSTVPPYIIRFARRRSTIKISGVYL